MDSSISANHRAALQLTAIPICTAITTAIGRTGRLPRPAHGLLQVLPRTPNAISHPMPTARSSPRVTSPSSRSSRAPEPLTSLGSQGVKVFRKEASTLRHSSIRTRLARPRSQAAPPLPFQRQFGDISTTGVPSNVNSAYTAAKPNVVLLTLGADDLQFVNILTSCIEWNYIPAGQRELTSRGRSGYSGNLQCSADNEADKRGPTSTAYPNGVIQDLYTNQLATLHSHLTTLLTAIEKEGQQSGQSGPPKIVITNYANPLPDNLPQKSGNSWASDFCPDTFPLYNAQVDYFSGLVDQLNMDMAQWVSAYEKSNEFRGQHCFGQLGQAGRRVSVV